MGSGVGSEVVSTSPRRRRFVSADVQTAEAVQGRCRLRATEPSEPSPLVRIEDLEPVI